MNEYLLLFFVLTIVLGAACGPFPSLIMYGFAVFWLVYYSGGANRWIVLFLLLAHGAVLVLVLLRQRLWKMMLNRRGLAARR